MRQETVAGAWNDKTSKTGKTTSFDKSFVMHNFLLLCIFLLIVEDFAGDVDRNREQQENHGSGYQDQRVQPCHLSSSIYYGGPDVYFQPQNSSINSTVIESLNYPRKKLET